MRFTEHLGTDSKGHVFGSSDSDYDNRLLSDGKQILINYGYGESFLLTNHAVTALSMNYEAAGIQTIEFTVKSYGPVQRMRFSDVAPHFKAATALPINDLLKIVYQKMEERSENENPGG